MGTPETFELPLHRLDRGLARFDQSRVATARALGRRIMPEGKPQESEAFAEVTTMGFLV
jgi:hypothetical protein